MSVHQLSDGRWIVQARAGAWPDHPERTRQYFGRGAEGKTAAEKCNRELGKRVYIRRGSRRKPVPFYEVANKYAASRRIENTESSIKSLGYKLEVILRTLKDVAAIRVDHNALREYIDNRLEESTVYGRPPKLTTIHRELTVILAVLRWAADPRLGLIPKNPAAGFRLPARDDEIIHPPTAVELKAILAHAPEHLFKALVIACFTGLRPGATELFRLTWADVDWGSRKIRITSARKGGPVRRFVPIHKEFLRQLKSWYKTDGKKENLAIIRFNGEPVQSVKRAWAKAKKDAGITRRIRLYDIRHFFASAVLEEGGDVKATSELLGHSRPDTTRRFYQHVSGKLHREAVDKLPGLGLVIHRKCNVLPGKKKDNSDT